MDHDKIETWSFEDLTGECVRRLFDALLTGGSKEMRREFYLVYNIIKQWQKANEEK